MDQIIYKKLELLDQKHWWFCGRRAIFIEILKKFMPHNRQKQSLFLDIGCGSGANLDLLSNFGQAFGVDSSIEALKILKKRGFNNVFGGELPYLTLRDRFDCITLFDVLEHIDNDQAALKNIFNHILPGGLLIGTVPAYNWLWSSYDEAVHHRRRYTKIDLTQKLVAQGFSVEQISYFNTLLFFPAAAVKILKKFSGFKKMLPSSELTFNLGTIDPLLTWIFSLERHLLKFVNLPFGLSIIFVVRRAKP